MGARTGGGGAALLVLRPEKIRVLILSGWDRVEESPQPYPFLGIGLITNQPRVPVSNQDSCLEQLKARRKSNLDLAYRALGA